MKKLGFHPSRVFEGNPENSKILCGQLVDSLVVNLVRLAVIRAIKSD
jgi:hypothetical protein